MSSNGSAKNLSLYRRWCKLETFCTLVTLIVAQTVDTFLKINKHTGPNKSTG